MPKNRSDEACRCAFEGEYKRAYALVGRHIYEHKYICLQGHKILGSYWLILVS